MIYTETLDALCNLPNEDIGQVMRHIKTWNDGGEPVIDNPYHKFLWSMILPDLERNKETYLSTLEKRQIAGRENGKLGGRPRKGNETQEKVMGFSDNPNNPNYNYNYNYNSNDSSKEESIRDKDGKHEPLDGGSVSEEPVSKGLESLEKIFPPRKNDIGIDEINLWNSLSQQNKKTMIQRASMYIRNENKKDEGKYIKKIGKWMREQIEKGFEESLPSMKNSTKGDDPRLLKHIDGQIYSILLSKVNNSTGKADKIYFMLNKKDNFNDKSEMLNFIYGMDEEEITILLES